MTTLATEVLAGSAGWGAGSWWPIFPLLWVLVLGVLVFALFRSRRGWDRRHQSRSAEGLLAERYARGEVSEDEYRERLSVLKENRS